MSLNPYIATSFYKSVPRFYPGAVSISCSAPKWFGNPPTMRQLAPVGFKNDPIARYVPKYMALLDGLDARAVVDQAKQLVYDRAIAQGFSHDDACDVTPVLLCWETSGDFCHRRLAAKWIQDELGIDCPEVQFKSGAMQVWQPKRVRAVADQPALF